MGIPGGHGPPHPRTPVPSKVSPKPSLSSAPPNPKFLQVREEGEQPQGFHTGQGSHERVAEQVRKTRQNEPFLPSNVESEEMEK